MSPTPVPTRITIDFRGAVRPSRGWILGVADVSDARIELDAFISNPGPAPMPAVNPADLAPACTCPEFCNRDHENE
jgi:hypothetical protein